MAQATRDKVEVTAVDSILTFVDRQIHEKGVECLKLIFYPLLHWNKLEKCEHPSEIYRLLKGSQVCEGSQEKALQIFLFALKAIGGHLRGKHCVQEAEKILGAKLPTPLDFSQQSSEFRFFYWLLKVVKRLPEHCHEHVIQHFSNTEGVNYRFIKGLPDLFILLSQHNKLSEDNTSELISTLEECKKHSQKDDAVMKCIDYISNIHSEEDPFSSG